MKDKIFGIFQRIGRSFMLPIAILPVAGLFLGISGSLTNQTTLETYGLVNIMGEGTFIYSLLTVLKNAGDIVFANLPIIFAMGVAIGMAKAEKDVAALSGAIAFFIMHASISALLSVSDRELPSGATASVLGINSLQMGVFGGIIVGLGVAYLHNRFYKIELPKVLSFFGGTRFVPIISAIVYLIVGIIMFYIWPTVQVGINAVGGLVRSSGYAGTLLYGFMERILIPFGLHHVFYLPFWQTSVGGTAMVDGNLIEGAQNIFFAELASPSTTKFSVEATRFMAGKFPLMIFGLPGAALAMYKCAKPEKRKIVGGLLLSAALTSMLTGITEPLEFTFLFVAPVLYVIHSILAGCAYMLMHIFKVGVGMTFSGGFIDMFLFGILQGNEKTNWINIVFVGIGYFIVYYFLFTFIIKKFNFKTPGREDEDVEVKLYTKADVNNKKSNENKSSNDNKVDEVSVLIIQGLGGKDNIKDIDCCATRLRITVFKPELVNEGKLKASGASGVIKKGDGVQVIYGPHVTVIKSNLEATMQNYEETDLDENYEPEQTTQNSSNEDKKEDDKAKTTVYSPLEGTAIALQDVKDGVFSEGMLGYGAAIEPTVGKLTSPVNGVVSMVFDTKHSIGITDENGAEILIHIGLDTVKLGGKHFEVYVNVGDNIKVGDKLIEFDIDAIKKEGYPVVTPIIISGSTSEDIKNILNGAIKNGDKLFDIN